MFHVKLFIQYRGFLEMMEEMEHLVELETWDPKEIRYLVRKLMLLTQYLCEITITWEVLQLGWAEQAPFVVCMHSAHTCLWYVRSSPHNTAFMLIFCLCACICAYLCMYVHRHVHLCAHVCMYYVCIKSVYSNHAANLCKQATSIKQPTDYVNYKEDCHIKIAQYNQSTLCI